MTCDTQCRATDMKTRIDTVLHPRIRKLEQAISDIGKWCYEADTYKEAVDSIVTILTSLNKED